MKTTLSVDDLITKVTQAGYHFTDIGEYRNRTIDIGIEIACKVFAGESRDVNAVYATGQALLEQVPRRRGKVFKPIEGEIIPWDEQGELMSTYIWVKVVQVDPVFLEAIKTHFPDWKKQVEVLEQLQTNYDELVESEIDEDPEVIKQKASLDAAQALVDYHATALSSRRAHLRQQRQDLRHSYLRVVSDREL